jgi:3-hydroxyacyl-[acyl-carrier-protein] dehydratase
MDFTLIDRVTHFNGDGKIVTEKHLSHSEEFLRDHFPGNPVMPGVLMLEAMVQSAAWMLRVLDDFRYSVIVLKEARNVKYGRFLSPGEDLRVEVELLAREGHTAKFRGKGFVGDAVSASGRFTLSCLNLAARNKNLAINDETLRANLREKWKRLAGNGQEHSAES